MEVILLENIEKLGARGQIVKVAAGYGRNYLLPKKLAVSATPQNRKWVEQQRVRFLKLEASEKAEAQELANLMADIEMVMTRRSGEKGQLFGSVTAMDIEDALAAQGFKIDRRKIQLGNPLKVLGEFDVPIKLHREVIVNVKVKVEGEAEPGQAAPEPEKAAPEPEKAATEAEEAAPEAS
jgi:large subunit ribosomal protein L9